MKKTLFLILAALVLLSACSEQKAPPNNIPDLPDSEQDAPVPETPNQPNVPDMPSTPDVPVTPDEIPENPEKPKDPNAPATPSDTPDKPVQPENPVQPEKPVQPTYPDISSFDRENRKIVYAKDSISLIDPAKSDTFTLPVDHSLISLGQADKYDIVLYKDNLYLTLSDKLTVSRPAVCSDMKKAFGGTLYLGGEKIVAIDPGHQSKGMYDKEPIGPDSSTLKTKVAAGTEGVSTKIAEYVLNLNVSLILRDELISRGYTVVMIRETHDVRISNAERAQMANAYKADAFIRVHANGSDNKNARGALAIFQTKENPWCGELYEQSKLLSETVLAAYCKNSGIENDGNWETDTMTGINWTTVPSTIIELGYMSNADEDKLMATSAFHKAAAVGIAQGIDNYFEKIK